MELDKVVLNQFNKLPFGITSAPEYFQKKMGEVLRDCNGVVYLMDNILILSYSYICSYRNTMLG